MNKLTIKRRNEFSLSLRVFWIYIDGKKVSKITNNETKILDIEKGNHTIQFKQDWLSSPKLSLNVIDSDFFVEVGGAVKPWLHMLLLCSLITLFVLLAAGIIKSFLWFFIVFAPYLYYFTLGSGTYISAKVTSSDKTYRVSKPSFASNKILGVLTLLFAANFIWKLVSYIAADSSKHDLEDVAYTCFGFFVFLIAYIMDRRN